MSPIGKRNPDTVFLSRTKVSPEKTAGEIQELLGRRARRVMNDYADGEVVGISFSIIFEGKEIFFRLPVRWKNYLPVFEKAQRAKRVGRYKPIDQEQAKRTAWRVAKAWLEAQFALIDSGMAELQEIMLPYLIQGPDEPTLYERLSETGFLLEHKP